jgi:UDP-2,3-diacylglucosamine pyrophosphatase LpxH
MKSDKQKTSLRFRSIWISDVHLGYKGCRADELLKFLHASESEYLYLVGDIVDIWYMKKGLFWPQEHNNVIRTILGKAKKGTKVIYIPGNHDEILRDYDGLRFGNVEIRQEAIHTAENGRRYLVMHGDKFDSVVTCSRLTAVIGDYAYEGLLHTNRVVNFIRRKMGFPYWSLAAYLKTRVKNAVKYISSFEHAVSLEAKKRNVDGLICGHIHRAELTRLNGVQYCNTGDWVENCTALAERHDGELELIHWANFLSQQHAQLKYINGRRKAA